MKRKYYMRGLGLGILITCIIFMIAVAFGNPMSDAAVRRRARQLGMVDAGTASGDASSRTIKELQEEQEKKDPTSATSSSSTTVTTDSKTGLKTTTTTTTRQLPAGDKPDDGREESDTEKTKQKAQEEKAKAESNKDKGDNKKTVSKPKAATPKAPEKVSVSISRGDTSADVGQKLQSAGLVDSGSDFDHFLEQHGYDRTIHSGTYSFTKGSSYSQIASKIAG